jgi:hypothetical protein
MQFQVKLFLITFKIDDKVFVHGLCLCNVKKNSSIMPSSPQNIERVIGKFLFQMGNSSSKKFEVQKQTAAEDFDLKQYRKQVNRMKFLTITLILTVPGTDQQVSRYA